VERNSVTLWVTINEATGEVGKAHHELTRIVNRNKTTYEHFGASNDVSGEATATTKTIPTPPPSPHHSRRRQLLLLHLHQKRMTPDPPPTLDQLPPP
jgi:hypothetical protein